MGIISCENLLLMKIQGLFFNLPILGKSGTIRKGKKSHATGS